MEKESRPGSQTPKSEAVSAWSHSGLLQCLAFIRFAKTK
jgi:hypothetical protein